MRALLLAAGLGSRLRPLTYGTPKCLVPVKGTPVLGHWLHLLERHGCTDVLINTGYHATQVHAFLDTFYTPLRIEVTHEKVLRGTGGTIKASWSFFQEEETFLVAHVDNFTNANLSAFRAFAAGRLGDHAPIAIGLFRCPRPSECGIVEVEGDGTIRAFHEKVSDPPGDLANAGIYICHRALKRHLDGVDSLPIDLCRDVLSRLEGRMIGWPLGDAFLLDIGSIEAYEKANLDPAYRVEIPPGRCDVEALLSSLHDF